MVLHRFALVAVSLVACTACTSSPPPVPPGVMASSTTESLEQRIRVASAPMGGLVGVAALHIESGDRFALHGDALFPMASVFKVPLALAVLGEVDRNAMALDESIAVTQTDLRVGPSPIAEAHPSGDFRVTLRELLASMLIASDNSAADILLRRIGGPEVVTNRLRGLGIAGIRVDRSELEMLLDMTLPSGVARPEGVEQWTRAVTQQFYESTPAETREAAEAAFDRDPRDTSTPTAMVELLDRTWRGKALSAASTKLLLDWMAETTTGPGRIKGKLPAGTVVAHKTGTTGHSTNDVGIIDMPNGTHVVLAVFSKESTAKLAVREAVIAQIARIVYEHALGRE